jgi:hypothetical protein
MYSLVCPSDSPPGGGRTVPRTVSRTALREDLRNSNGHSDSPSGGPSKLGRSLGQPFGRTLETRTLTRTALREAHSKQPLGHKDRNYNLSMRLHTYGVTYPAGLRRPELVPAGTQTVFRLYETISLGGRERESQIMHGICMRVRVKRWQPTSPLFIGNPKG